MAAVVSSEMLSRVPLIVIVGATGTGKTKLSVELAKRFGGEIINADSMQVYRELDIITNKASAEERAGVPHHLLGHIEPLANYNVVHFRNEAISLIGRLHSLRRLPVIVGGTHYYVESIMWKMLVSRHSHEDADADAVPVEAGDAEVDVGSSSGESADSSSPGRLDLEPPGKRSRTKSFPISKWTGVPDIKTKTGMCDSTTPTVTLGGRTLLEVDKMSSEEAHRLLTELDPARASQVHPANIRRVKRSLQVLAQTGRKHSTILEEQREESGLAIGGCLRYPGALVFWTQCQQDILTARLNSRVDEMVEKGLVDEVLTFHERWNAQRLKDGKEDYEHGIFQSIGFKEFRPYVTMSPEERATQKGQDLLAVCIDMLKVHTRQYANRQLRWINNRFLRPGRDVPPLWAVDASQPDKWDELVSKPAVSVVEHYLRGELPPSDVIKPVPLMNTDAHSFDDKNRIFRCDVCDISCVGVEQHQLHLNGGKHARRLARLKRLQATPTPGTSGQDAAGPQEVSSSSSSPASSSPHEGSPQIDESETLPVSSTPTGQDIWASSKPSPSAKVWDDESSRDATESDQITI